MKTLLRALLVAALAVCGLPAHAAHQDGNLVCETTTTTGTGSLTLSETGCDGGDFVTFASQITTGNTITYSIVASDGTLETGTAVYTAGSPDTITSRSAIWSSGGSGVELTLPAGTHRVYLQWNTASYQGGLNAFDVLSISVDNLNDVTALNATTESTVEAAIDTLANLTSVQARTVTLADAGADAFLIWDDSANAYQNASNADAIAALGIDLGTDTTGNYVDNVTGGSGITVTHTPGEGSEPDVVFDATEINSLTWGSGTFTTMTFNAGATDPVLTFGSGTLLIEALTSFRQADAANLGGNIRLLEDPGTGSNYIGFLAPASITSDVTCTLENDANPIPDSCVGDGTDAGGGGAQTPWTSDIDAAGFDLHSVLTIVTNHTAPLSTYDQSGLTPVVQIIGTTANNSAWAATRFATTGSSKVILAHAGGTTIGSYTALAVDETIGEIQFHVSDGTDFNRAAGIIAKTDATQGNQDVPGRLVFMTTADAGVAPIERWIIDSAGVLKPATNDAAAIGITSLRVSDIFLADGGVIDIGTTSSRATITHVAATDSITIAADPDNATATSVINLAVDGSNHMTVCGGVNMGVGGSCPGTNGYVRLYSAADSAAGPQIYMQHNDPSADAGDYPASINVVGGADDEEIGWIAYNLIDPATTTEDGKWEFMARVAGVDTTLLTVGGGHNGGGFGTMVEASLGSCDGCTFEVFTNTTGVQGPTIFLNSDSASPANADVPGQIWTSFRDNGGGATPGWRMIGSVVDVVATTEDVNLTFSMMTAGAVVSMFAIGNSGTALDAATTWIGTSGYTANNGTGIYFEETEANGDNYKAFVPIAAITTSTTCTFENDANFIPDSCVGDGSDASDGRLKTDLKPAGDVGALLDQIKIYDYAWTADAPEASEAVRKGKRGFGPVAQELINVSADFVEAGGDDPVRDPWTWKPERVVPYLIVEIQHLRQRVKELEARHIR